MPAVSQAQRQAARDEIDSRKAGNPPMRFQSMSTLTLVDYASTPREGLPERLHPKRKRGR